MRYRATWVFVTIVALASGCIDPLGTAPSPAIASPASAALLGSWSSMSTVTSDTCQDFHWVVTEAEADTAAGTFTATCFGGMPASGTAHGTVSASSLTWTATAIVTASTQSSCAISLIGTAQVGQDEIGLVYTGTTCLGDTSGRETLKKG
jgi:hypothetical protein